MPSENSYDKDTSTNMPHTAPMPPIPPEPPAPPIPIDSAEALYRMTLRSVNQLWEATSYNADIAETYANAVKDIAALMKAIKEYTPEPMPI